MTLNGSLTTEAARAILTARYGRVDRAGERRNSSLATILRLRRLRQADRAA